MKASTCNRQGREKRRRGRGAAALTAVFWLCLWQLACTAVGKEYIIPAPAHTLLLLGRMLLSAEFYVNAAWTMGRVVSGIALSLFAGSLLAAAAYLLFAVRQLCAGVMATLKSVPVMAVILLAILWLPTDGVPVFVCFLMCCPVVYTNLLEGLDNVEPALQEMCSVYGISGWRRLRVLYWPSLRPYLRAACVLATGLSWKTVVAAEILAVPRFSMGYHLLSAKAVLAADELFAWTIAIVLLSFGFEKAVRMLLSGRKPPAQELVSDATGAGQAETAKTGEVAGHAAEMEARKEVQATDAEIAAEKAQEGGNSWVAVRLCGVSKAFGELQLYRNFSLSIAGGRVTAIVGPSGGGKTTLLRLIAGLERPDAGSITVESAAQESRADGRAAAKEIGGASRRGSVSVVFQEDRLLPWLTVRENLRAVLRQKEKQEDAVDDILRMMGLLEFGDYIPQQLSGGMRRRVAMGRALLFDSEVTLMDEPFTGLDPELKQRLQQEIRSLWRRRAKTIVFITHDLQEAAALADEVYQLRGRPAEVTPLSCCKNGVN